MSDPTGPTPTDNNLDPELQKEIEDSLGDMSIEEMMMQSAPPAASPKARSVREGQTVTGKVAAVQGEDIFIDFGGKDQGVLPASQFGPDEPLPEVGSSYEVRADSFDNSEGLWKLSKPDAAVEAAWDTLETGQIVEGRVTALNTGGLELNIDGLRGFMPISHIELYRVEDLKPYINTKLKCQVMDLKPAEKNLVVSRRAILEAEQAELRQELFEKLTEGQEVSGKVKNIMPYGAFVDIGGADGLLHISDLSYSRVEKVEDVLKVGQELQVKILKIDREEKKLRLGLKQAKPDPWESAEGKWPVDAIVSGRVVRLADFGAFVELEEGVDALLPISELSFARHVKHPSEIVSEGDVIQVRVIKSDPAERKISLSLKRVGDDPWSGASVRWAPDSVVEGVVRRTTDFGAFVELAPGVEGLVHISELSNEFVRSVSEAVSEGDTVQCKVLSVEEDRRRISLSIKQASDSAAPSEAPASAPDTPSEASNRKKKLKGGLDGGSISFGDLKLG